MTPASAWRGRRAWRSRGTTLTTRAWIVIAGLLAAAGGFAWLADFALFHPLP